jgi:NADH-quinone oxidoreductase subunit L
MSWLSPIIGTLFLFTSAITCVILTIKGWHLPQRYTIEWFTLASTPLNFIIDINDNVLIMLMMVTLVSFFIHVYSIGFMAHDNNTGRYFSSLGLFTFSMLGLVISGDLLLMFIFWELVGLSSWLLIGFWRERPEAAAAATRAFLYNRVGDAFFLVGILITWANTNFTSFSEINVVHGSWSTIASLCIFGGVIGKSAQFPLSGWLPEAMEGPTPVSALIHAATMVAAGVFVVFRIYPFFTDNTLMIVALVGSVTALYNGILALRQTDLKKILAYSTISQLGLMMIALGTHSPNGAFVHLIAHGFFKACLFVSAGSVIYKLYSEGSHHRFDPQDVRNMGGLRTSMPDIFLSFTIAAASLAGIPFLSGFISKEQIIIPMISRAMLTDPGVWIFSVVFYLTTFITVLYTWRMWSMVFLGKFRGHQQILAPSPTPPIMQWPMVALAIGSLWLVFSMNPFTSQPWMFGTNDIGDNPITFVVTFTSVAWTILAMVVAWQLQKRAIKQQEAPVPSKIYDRFVAAPALIVAKRLEQADQKLIDHTIHRLVYIQVIFAFSIAWIDRHIIDGLVTFATAITNIVGNFTRSLGSGRIQRYVLWAAAALIIFIFYVLE